MLSENSVILDFHPKLVMRNLMIYIIDILTCHLATNISIGTPSPISKHLRLICDWDAEMAVSLWKSNVACSHRRRCRFYFPVIGMAYGSIHNAPIPRKVISNTEMCLGRMERNFVNGECCLSNRTNCMHKHIHAFHMGGNCDLRKTTQTNFQMRNAGVSRWYSDDGGPPREKFPNMMDFPEIVWPSVIKAFRNWILTNILIKPYFDKDFGLPDFVLGSKQAVEYVAGCLSRGDFAALENVVTQEALQELKRNISTFSLQQRQELALSKEDVYFCFPYEIGIMFINDDKLQQKRFVEITMCYHVLQGLKLLREQGINIGMLPEYRHKLYICNCRFIREFTKGVEDQWTVNIINHFKPSDFTG